MEFFEQFMGDGAGFDVPVLDDRKDLLAALLGGGDVLHLGPDAFLDDREDQLDGAAARLDPGAQLVVDTGERSTGRGRSGAYYAVSGAVGTALVASIAPGGIVVEAVDAHGSTLARTSRSVVRPARPEQVGEALAAAAREVSAAGPVRVAVISAADPVDRVTGRTVDLPDAPFLLGNLSPAEIVAPFVAGAVVVDNDVNWAARAERVAAEDFAYLYLGEGLGLAVVSDGEVRRGHHGIAGEISHVLTVGCDGRAAPLTEVLASLGLRQAGSTAVDVSRVVGESGDVLATEPALTGARSYAVSELRTPIVSG